MKFFIPARHQKIHLLEDWTFKLDWDSNLTFLKKYGVTMSIPVVKTKYEMVKFPLKAEEYTPYIIGVHIPYTGSETVKNKMFMDDNGRYVPVQVTLPKGSVIKIFKIKGVKNSFPNLIGFEILSCSDPKLVKKNFTVDFDELNTLEFDMA